MKEIEDTPWNGYNVVSTFSGGGGSCLGYRIAGYKVLYANEFVEEAQNTYRRNHPSTTLDTRDIRTVTGEDILRMTGLKKGEIDLFDGSPPCCAFSVCGVREKGWGKERAYSDGKTQRIDDLFFEYIRLIKELQPKTFVAENVAGLVRGTALGYFKNILKEMKACGYRVKAAVLDASKLGVPQKRQRLIFVGVREDLGLDPVLPKALKYTYTIGDAFKDLVNDDEQAKLLEDRIKMYKVYETVVQLPKDPDHQITGEIVKKNSRFNLKRESLRAPCGTICQLNGGWGTSGNLHPLYDRKFTIPELKRITSLPDDFILTGDFPQQWERAGRMVPPIMMSHIAKTVQTEILDKVKK